jgi:hypothetical protein
MLFPSIGVFGRLALAEGGLQLSSSVKTPSLWEETNGP